MRLTLVAIMEGTSDMLQQEVYRLILNPTSLRRRVKIYNNYLIKEKLSFVSKTGSGILKNRIWEKRVTI